MDFFKTIEEKRSLTWIFPEIFCTQCQRQKIENCLDCPDISWQYMRIRHHNNKNLQHCCIGGHIENRIIENGDSTVINRRQVYTEFKKVSNPSQCCQIHSRFGKDYSNLFFWTKFDHRSCEKIWNECERGVIKCEEAKSKFYSKDNCTPSWILSQKVIFSECCGMGRRISSTNQKKLYKQFHTIRKHYPCTQDVSKVLFGPNGFSEIFQSTCVIIEKQKCTKNQTLCHVPESCRNFSPILNPCTFFLNKKNS